MLKTVFLPQETLFTAFLSRMARESQHTHFEDQILGQVGLWGRKLCQPDEEEDVDDAGDEEEDVDDDGESNTNMMIIPLREYANGIETSPQSFIIFSPNRYFSLMIFDHLWMDEARWWALDGMDGTPSGVKYKAPYGAKTPSEL